jgi:hypothetical protein
MWAADPFDLLGDYTQTATFLVLIATILIVEFENCATSFKRRYLLLSIVGFIVGILMIMKQTHGVSCIILFGMYFALRCWLLKDIFFAKYICVTLCGFIIPVLICAGWLYLNDALLPFYECCYGGSTGKGSVFSVLFLSVVNSVSLVARSDKERMLCVILYCGFIMTLYKNLIVSRMIRYTLFGGFLLVGLLMIWSSALGWMVFVISFILYAYYYSPYRWRGFWTGTSLLVAAGIIGTFMCSHKWVERLARLGEVDFKLILLFVFLVIIIYAINFYFFKKTPPLPVPVIVLLIGAGVNFYAEVMSSMGWAIPARVSYIGVPVIVCLLMTYPQNLGGKARKMFVFSLVFVAVTVCCAKKIKCPYSWFGWHEPSLIQRQEKSLSNKPLLKGFKFSLNYCELYENVLASIRDNSSQNDTLLAFPHMPVLNMISGRRMGTKYTPVLFFDVCSDENAYNEGVYLRENPPKIVVWCDFPDFAWSLHEEIFRNGNRMGQRDIQEWMHEMVKSGKYKLVGQYGHVFTYARDDGDAHRFVYRVSNPMAVPITLEERLLRRK